MNFLPAGMPRNQSLAEVPGQEASRFLRSTSIRILIFGWDELETRCHDRERIHGPVPMQIHGRSAFSKLPWRRQWPAYELRVLHSCSRRRSIWPTENTRGPVPPFRCFFPACTRFFTVAYSTHKKDVVAQLFSHDSDHRIRLRPPFSLVERDTTLRASSPPPVTATKPNSERRTGTCDYVPPTRVISSCPLPHHQP